MNQGDKVQLKVTNSEMYSYELPEDGSQGTVIQSTFHMGLLQMFGVELPVVMVNFSTGICSIFPEDLRLIEENKNNNNQELN
jgi:hypothetical protein